MLFSILAVLIFLFLFVNLLFYISIKKVFSEQTNQSSQQKISVVIAAKNEEKNIPALIEALNKQDYEKNLFEVIIVDDFSIDNTFTLAVELTTKLKNFKAIKAERKNLPGKKGALTEGIRKTNFDFILITDADCIPMTGWLKAFAGKFSEGYDFIFGVAPFQIENSLVNNLSCFENIRSNILTFTAALVTFPYSVAARNFGFKKSSFEKVKGYSNTTETLSGDDDLLIREAVKNKMKIGIITDKDSFVFSKTKNTLSEYLKQKARHTQTSLHYLPIHKIMLALWHLTNLIFLFSPLLIFFNLIFFSLFTIKMVTDIVVVYNLQKYFGYNFNPIKILCLQIVYELSLIFNFINAVLGKSDWNK
jgi:cellulose synthase/poly-beta-1,6-N-acetylglucosamine synthase-like glycosyltransferase